MGIWEAQRKAIEAANDVMAFDLLNGELDHISFIEIEHEIGQQLFAPQRAEAVSLTERRR